MPGIFLTVGDKTVKTKANNLNRTISIKEIESIINNFQIKKHQAQMGSLQILANM